MAGKYRNVATIVNGIRFDSAAEALRYLQLAAMESAGSISDLKLQVPFLLAPAVLIPGKLRKSPALRYFADFVYDKNGVRVVEDVKGAITSAYKIKRHLLAVQGITITEIRA